MEKSQENLNGCVIGDAANGAFPGQVLDVEMKPEWKDQASRTARRSQLFDKSIARPLSQPTVSGNY